MHHLRLGAVRMVERRQRAANDCYLLVERERHRALLDVLPQSVPGHVFGDQHKLVLSLVREEIAHGEDMGVTRQRCYRLEGILDPAPLALAFR